MTVSDAHKAQALEAENLRLKKIVAEQMLAIRGFKGNCTKKW
jgi:putative transposase